jgi:hypothetical protein
MKVIKGIDKGNMLIKELEYSNDWGKVIKDHEVIQNLTKLQSLILNINEDGNFEATQREAFRIRKLFFDPKNPASTILNGVRDDIHKITFLGKGSKPIVVNDLILIDFIIDSFYDKLHTFASEPKNGRPSSNFKNLLSIGGYEIIQDLKAKGLTNKFLFDFVTNGVKKIIHSEDITDERKLESKFPYTTWENKFPFFTLPAFKQSLSEYKKEINKK